MAYASQTNRPNPSALIGAFAVPAAFGALLIAGLAVTGVLPEDDEVLTGWNVPKVPPPEPMLEPEPDRQTEKATANTQKTQTRRNPSPTFEPGDTTVNLGSDTLTGTLPKLGGDDLGPIGPVDWGIPDPVPTATLDPVAAAPRGNPGGWITDSDYRSSWINRGYAGTAGFTLAVDASGRVAGCTITRSTGHAALDKATCRLLERRARFDPAKNSAGDPVAGRFSSKVNWRIPE